MTGRPGHAPSARMHDGAEASSPHQLSVKDSGKYICTEYEIMTISIKNNYTYFPDILSIIYCTSIPIVESRLTTTSE